MRDSKRLMGIEPTLSTWKRVFPTVIPDAAPTLKGRFFGTGFFYVRLAGRTFLRVTVRLIHRLKFPMNQVVGIIC